MQPAHNIAIDHGARRGRSRLKTRLPARIITLAGTFTVVLHDISLTGARIGADAHAQAQQQPREGETAILQWGSFEKMGHFVWINDSFAGIQFEEPVSPAELLETRGLQDDFSRMGGMQADATRFANEWVNGIRAR